MTAAEVTTQSQKGFSPAARAAVMLFALAAYGALSIYFFLGAGSDDLFLTYWQAEQLAAGKGLVNYNYEPAEISSSLLHTVLLALMYRLTSIDMYVLGKVFGFVLGACSFILGIALSRTALQAVLFTLFLLCVQSFLYWSWGGLETSLFAFLLFGYALTLDLAVRKNTWWPSAVFGIACILTRPEGFVVIFVAAAVFLFFQFFTREKVQARHFAHLGVLIGAQVALVIFRYYSHGFLFPVPAYAKAQFSYSTLSSGLDYIYVYMRNPWGWFNWIVFGWLTVFAGVRVIRGKSLGTTVPVFLAVLIGYGFFIAFSGGDWMGYGRFFAPIAPSAAFIMAYGLFEFVQSRAVKWAVIFGTAASLILGLGLISEEPKNNSLICRDPLGVRTVEDLMRYNHIQRQDMRSIMPYLKGPFRQHVLESGGRPTLLSHQAGFFPYYARKLHPELDFYFLDTYGLAEPGIARMEAPRNRTGIKWAGDYAGILKGLYHDYSVYIIRRNPFIAYTERTWDPSIVREMRDVGFELVWNMPARNYVGALVFKRTGTSHPIANGSRAPVTSTADMPITGVSDSHEPTVYCEERDGPDEPTSVVRTP